MFEVQNCHFKKMYQSEQKLYAFDTIYSMLPFLHLLAQYPLEEDKICLGLFLVSLPNKD